MKKLVLLVFLAGCATLKPNEFQVTYYSDPPGAILFQGPQNFGRMPVTLTYTASDYELGVGESNFHGTTARWISGATASIESIRISHAQGRKQHFTFTRPAGVAGLEHDISYAMQLQQAANAAEQLRLQRQSLGLQAIQHQQQMELLRQQQLNRNNINCTSQRSGNTVHTNCF